MRPATTEPAFGVRAITAVETTKEVVWEAEVHRQFPAGV